MSAYDAVVVGGRAAGAATAMLLARAGLTVVVVERARAAADTVSTHGLMRAGVLQLSRWGLLDAIQRAGTPPVRRTIFHYPGLAPVTVTLRPRLGVDALYAPRGLLLERILLGAAEEAGADLMRGTVTEVLRDDVERVVGVRLVLPDGRERLLRARHTIGADGIDSVVARQVGSEILTLGRHASAVLYRSYDALPAAGYEWFYASGTSAGLIPTNAEQTCLFVGTTPSGLRLLRRDGSEQAFAALIRGADRSPSHSLADRVLASRPVGPLHGWAGHPGFLRRSHGPGWALVGDAGSFTDPITAHGMSDALRDAQLLADAVVEAASGRVHEQVALARYQLTRDRLSQRLLAATEAVAAYDWDTPTIRRLLREVSASMSDEIDHLEALDGAGAPSATTAWVGSAGNVAVTSPASRTPREGPTGGRRAPR